MAFAGHAAAGETTSISFREWSNALTAAGFWPAERDAHRREIIAFLRFCKLRHAPVTVVLAREYLGALSPAQAAGARLALRWFFRVARQQGSPATAGGSPPPALPGAAPRPAIPPRACDDLGHTPWESALIQAVRRKGFLWRTEQTYRRWASQFAAFLQPRSPYAAEGEDVAAFLSQLAVRQRASAATQKQALNALVFFLQEGLHRSVGQFDFDRARARRRVPTVLSRGECERLFAQLPGTSRLMAELMYGAGLRLMELLRLRIHHLDMDRHQVKIHAGKGDRDRLTVLPQSLVPRLQAHVVRLRTLFAEDRAAGRAGVWLPEGLARKYGRAGEQWEWQWLFPSRELSTDPATGLTRRHHVLDGTFQNAIRAAARRRGCVKRYTLGWR